MIETIAGIGWRIWKRLRYFGRPFGMKEAFFYLRCTAICLAKADRFGREARGLYRGAEIQRAGALANTIRTAPSLPAVLSVCDFRTARPESFAREVDAALLKR
jgi:hypothetical protein